MKPLLVTIGALVVLGMLLLGLLLWLTRQFDPTDPKGLR